MKFVYLFYIFEKKEQKTSKTSGAVNWNESKQKGRTKNV